MLYYFKTVNRQHTILPSKSIKRPRNETNDASTVLNGQSSQSIIDKVFELSKIDAQTKPMRAYKKRKQEEKAIPIYYNDDSQDNVENFSSAFGDQLNDFDDDEIENNDDFDQSITSSAGGDKKKRVLTKNQRVAANQRERKRMNIMNESFLALRQALPISTGRKRRKMSRLDIVIGAMEYITYLDELLKSTDGPCVINFDAYQNSVYFYD